MTTLFHITTREAWDNAERAGRYDGDTLASEGFIHCSTATQVEEVANRLFCGRRDLVVLVIETRRVVAEIRYENLEGGTELYPHVYGSLGTDAVQRVEAFTPDAAGRFSFP